MTNMPLLFDNDVINRFIDEMDTIESTQPMESGSVLSSAALLLLQIKSSQRNLFKKFHIALQDRDAKRKHLASKRLLLQNLIYERDHLKLQLNDCHDVPTPYLERMAREEMDDEVPMNQSSFEIINQFLCETSDLSILDPKNHKQILNKLHKELHARGSLQRELEKAQALTKRKIELESEKAFLKDLPARLDAIEQSTIPLQKFFHEKQKHGKGNAYLQFLGTDRNKRLDLAKSLPGPLYTMFMTLQANLDNRNPEQTQLISLHIATTTHHDFPVLHLRFQLQDIHQKEISMGDELKSYVTIEFSYSQETSLITAKSSGSDDKINHAMLLGCLFPDDTGQWLQQSEVMQAISGDPYHWCNYIAGLIRPAPSSFHSLCLNADAVMHALEQRIRTNSILVQLLSNIEKTKKPSAHPSFVQKFEISGCVLMDWKKANEFSRTLNQRITYMATLQNLNGSTLYANVTIDWYSYPTTRPAWNLQLEYPDASSQSQNNRSVTTLFEGTNPLYSKKLSLLESQIQNEDVQSLVDINHPESFHWILSHQLLYLMQLWQEMGTTIPPPPNTFKGVGNTFRAAGSRMKRGRDRARIL
jgi:hypothetical protein